MVIINIQWWIFADREVAIKLPSEVLILVCHKDGGCQADDEHLVTESLSIVITALFTISKPVIASYVEDNH